ncbi:MAG: glycosyltransferase family 9 protein [Acidimicrobiales bacterium]
MTARCPRLVVLRALKLGDFLTAVPALRALMHSFPDHEIVLAAPAWLEPLVVHAGAVDRLVDTPGLVDLDPSLHGGDVAVNLHGSGPHSTALLAATSPTRLLSFGLAGGPVWRDDEHERERWCRLLREFAIPAGADDLRLDVPDIAAPGSAIGATLLHPGASSEARRWPVERWAAVARAEVEAGRPVALTGDATEAGLATEVARRAGLDDDTVLAGRTDLLELLATVAGAERVVCGDTGVAHVASAMGTPSVVLFGPTSPARWGPPATGPHLALWKGRTGDPHANQADPGLLAISVDDVLETLACLPEHHRSRVLGGHQVEHPVRHHHVD